MVRRRKLLKTRKSQSQGGSGAPERQALRVPALALVCLLFLQSCKDMGSEPAAAPAPPPPPPGVTVSFRNDILPLCENAGCVGCHGGTSGLTLGSVAGLLKGGLHGPAIVPGHADSSNMFRKISSNPPFGVRMPQGGPYLSPDAIQTIRNWIDQGAKDN
jgi:hypothetical protein